MKEKLVLVDGNSIVNRAFYGLPELTTTDGKHTNGILGFFNILLKLIEEEHPQYMAVAFDLKHPTFRHTLFSDYKGTRKGMPAELADDILGTLAKKGKEDGLEVSLVSGDKDLLQIADDVIKVRIPKTKRTGTEIEDYYAKDVVAKYGLQPKQIVDLKGLMGDTSDNIPGVSGIGEKTAVKLLSEFETVENVLAHVEEVTANKVRENLKKEKEIALLSKQLATIKTDCELEFTYEMAKLGNIFTKEAYQIFKQLEMKSLVAKFALSEQEMVSTVSISDEFIQVDGLNEVESLFVTLAKEISMAIVPVLKEERLLGVMLATEKTKLIKWQKKVQKYRYLKQSKWLDIFRIKQEKIYLI